MSFEIPIGPQHIKNRVVFNNPRTPRNSKAPKFYQSRKPFERQL